VTLFFSQDILSTIAHVIPTMDCLGSLLSGFNTQLLSPLIKHVLKFAYALINKYYLKTDMSNVYQIVISKHCLCLVTPHLNLFAVLHPNLKLKYFHNHGWEKAWIDMAEVIVPDKYAKYTTLKKSEPTTVCHIPYRAH
jgi:hypothetical protein